jgi:hypothetical protein
VLETYEFSRPSTSNEKAERFGRITSGELIPFTIGAGAYGKVGLDTTISTGEQKGVLLKTKVPESPSFATDIKPTTTAEFKGSGLGFDNFKITESVNEIAIPKNKKGTDVLIGETKNGYTDVYLKLNKEQAKSLSQTYTGNTRNIKTSEGSFLEFEPTGKITNPVYEKQGLSKLGTSEPEPELIGNMPVRENTGSAFNLRFEKKVNLQKGRLDMSNTDVLKLPEFTKTINSNGKIVDDFNINNYYKKPKFEEPLHLNSGHNKKSYRRSISDDSTGVMTMSDLFVDTPLKDVIKGYSLQKKPTYIGEMSNMQTRYVKFEQPLTKTKNDMSEMQNLYNDAKARGKDPIVNKNTLKNISLSRYANTGKSPRPFIPTSSNKNPFGKKSSITQNNTFTITKAKTDTTPDSKTIFKTSTSTKSITDVTKTEYIPDIVKTSRKSKNEIPLVVVPTFKLPNIGEKTNKSKKGGNWKYDRLTNNFGSLQNAKWKW